jgi:CheY-like chemotaxis protein
LSWLIVEDEEDIRNIVSIMAGVWGHSTVVFPDGYKATKWIDEVRDGTYQDELPELALLDIRMPGPTGDQIAGRLRQTEGLKDMAIVMMTAFTLPGDEYKKVMETSGADKLIYKPLPGMDELKQILDDTLATRKAGRT